MFATMMETPLNAAPMTPVMGRACPAFQTPVLAEQEGELSWKKEIEKFETGSSNLQMFQINFPEKKNRN